MTRTILVTTVLAVLAGAPAFAQTAAPGPTPKGGTAAVNTPKPVPARMAPDPRSPASLDCSKQADDKGLHGKARKKFRSSCMMDAKKKPM